MAEYITYFTCFFYSETKITHFYLFSFAFISFHLLYHSLSFAVVTRCYSLSFIVTRCHLLSIIAAIVVFRCDTRLSFYKRSYQVEN